MKVNTITLARTLAFLDFQELSPRGTVYLPSLVPYMVERFDFTTFPKAPTDFGSKDGTVFKDGFRNGLVVDELTFYTDGIKIDLRSSTDDGKAMILDTLEWLSAEHGVYYDESTISRWAYISNLVFSSDLNLNAVNTAFGKLAQRINDALRGDVRVPRGMQVSGIQLDVERIAGSPAISAFTIERRKNVAFEEGKYFSASPLPTGVHINVLEQFESDLLAQL